MEKAGVCRRLKKKKLDSGRWHEPETLGRKRGIRRSHGASSNKGLSARAPGAEREQYLPGAGWNLNREAPDGE